MCAAGYRWLREAHGQADGTDRVHGEAHEVNARQVLPHSRARTGQRKLLVRSHALALHATWARTGKIAWTGQ